jgi:hypothetical protein
MEKKFEKSSKKDRKKVRKRLKKVQKKVQKNYLKFEISFPPSNILFFPGQYFSEGVGKQKISPVKSSFHDTNIQTYL